MKVRKHLPYRIPAILEGAARIVDFGGTLDVHYYQQLHSNRARKRNLYKAYLGKTSYEAMQADYDVVAQDMSRVTSSSKPCLSFR
jgi:hypothetical protein